MSPIDIEMSLTKEPSTVDLFFPRLAQYTSEPDVPYQYMQNLTRSDELQDIEDMMWLICVWATDNLEHKWYIRKSSLDIDVWKEKISFEFNFVDPADQMAFKLMWC